MGAIFLEEGPPSSSPLPGGGAQLNLGMGPGPILTQALFHQWQRAVVQGFRTRGCLGAPGISSS